MSRLSTYATFFGLLYLSAVISVLTATSILENDDEAGLERRHSDEEVEIVIRRLYERTVRRRLFPRNSISTEADNNGDCTCTKNNCGCCQRLSLPKLKIDKTLCENITFFSQQLGMKLSLSLDGRQIYSTNVTIKQPPPMCFKLSSMISACLYLYDINYSDRALSGCSKIEVKSFGKIIAEIKMSCFRIPLANDIDLLMTSSSDVPAEEREIMSNFLADEEPLQQPQLM